MKRKMLITAGGTAIAWHLLSVIKDYFAHEVETFLCDINPRWLVPGSTKCDTYLQVPKIIDPEYYQHMVGLLAGHGIDIFVPLIDHDITLFPCDNKDLEKLGVKSTAPPKQVTERITDKVSMYDWMSSISIPIPRRFAWSELDDETKYLIKPRRGYGSGGVCRLRGSEIRAVPRYETGFIIQEVCSAPETTVEVYRNRTHLRLLCRERLETKSGVCTKARFFLDDEIEALVGRIAREVVLPVASCLQFMRHPGGGWCLIDFNLRLGAGTALSSATGFELVRAALCTWLDHDEDPLRYLRIPATERFAVRVYQEILMQ